MGVLYPADGDLDRELWRFLPEGVSMHLTRTPAPEGELTVESVRAEAESPGLESAARMLSTIPLDCIAFLCTAATFIGGPGYDQKVLRRIEEASGLPATTTSTALLEALRALEIAKLVVVAPYPKPVTERLVEFLAGNGFDVVGSHTMGIRRATNIGGVSAGDVYRQVRQADVEAAEGIFISCTALQTVDVLQTIEQDLAKPVLSANQVTLWHSLKLVNIREGMPHLGRLYSLFP